MQTFQFSTSRVNREQLAFSADGRWLGIGTGPFTLLDTADGSAHTIPQRETRYGKTFVWAFAFVRGGAALAYAPVGGDLFVLDLETRELSTKKLDDANPYALAADPRGAVLYVAAHPPDGSKKYDIRRLDAGTLRQQAAFAPTRAGLERLVISANGSWLASSYLDHVWAWNLDKEELPERPPMVFKLSAMDTPVALCADGSLVAAVDRVGLHVHKTKGGKELFYSGKHRRTVTAVAWHPAKLLIATGDNAGNVFLWDHTGRVLTRYDWGLGEVRGLCFSADGLRAAAADAKGKVVVWDVDV